MISNAFIGKDNTKRTDRIIICVLLLFFTLIMLPSAGQAAVRQDQLVDLSQTSQQKMDVMTDERFGTIGWLKGKFKAPVPGDPEESAYRFMETYPGIFQINSPRDEFYLIRIKRDRQAGTQHYYFDQRLNGIPVWGHRIGFHFDAEGDIYLINGRYGPSMAPLSITPSLTVAGATESAKDALRVFPSQPAAVTDNIMQREGAEETPLFDTAAAPTAELVYFPDQTGALHLSYLVRLSVVSPPGAWLFFIEAATGKVLFRFNNIQSAGPAVGSGLDLKNSTVTLHDYLDGADGKYKLIDASKYMYTHSPPAHPYSAWKGVIEIRDCKNAVDSKGQAIANPFNAPEADPNGDNESVEKVCFASPLSQFLLLY